MAQDSFTLPTVHDARLWLDNKALRCVLLDYEDYLWAIRWRWTAKVSRGGRKFYATRTESVRNKGLRHDICRFLHVEVHKRTGAAQPSPAHTVVDHRNGDSLDCRRGNLRWATHSMNRRNIRGLHGHDLVEG